MILLMIPLTILLTVVDSLCTICITILLTILYVTFHELWLFCAIKELSMCVLCMYVFKLLYYLISQSRLDILEQKDWR